jgi:hypothetical protein
MTDIETAMRISIGEIDGDLEAMIIGCDMAEGPSGIGMVGIAVDVGIAKSGWKGIDITPVIGTGENATKT